MPAKQVLIMEQTVEKMLHDLRIISQISIGDKISTSTDQIDINREGILQPIVRTLYGDTRMKTYTYIANTVNNAITIMTLLMESIHLQDKEDSGYHHRYHTLYSLYMAFNGSAIGIANLVITYHADPTLVMQLREIARVQDEIIPKIKDKLGM